MRRSLAPSQRGSKPLVAVPVEKKPQNDGNQITISRMPMFGFLQIPEALNKQFKVPSGCVITEESIRLRKVKSLGGSRANCIIRPGQYQAFTKPSLLESSEEPLEDEENDEEGLPKVNLPPFEPLVLWRDANDPDLKIEVIPELASKLRPHQREGVQFLFECTMGLRGFEGQGCILADDMGLGKTLMSITLLWTLLNQGTVKGTSAVTKAVIVCPTSLVGNWDNEIRKWVGERCPTFAVKSEPKKMIKNFVQHRGKAVLIVSYETQRLYSNLFEPPSSSSKFSSSFGGGCCCDLLICDEAHKLKNSESGLSKSLNLLPAKKRVLLSGTPMQNELTEFYNMVNFCNPMILGTIAEFKRRYEKPILASREPDASESELKHAAALQKELSTIVNEFILKRGNALNAQHLPPKLVQFVCCRLTPLQESLYETLLSSKEMRHVREGKQLNTLNSIRQLINICSHPRLILDGYNQRLANKEPVDDDLKAMVELIQRHNASNPSSSSGTNGVKTSISGGLAGRFGLSTRTGFPGVGSSGGNSQQHCDPEQSGKMSTLFRMIQTMKAVKQGERIVVVSNYTQTLDLIEQMCSQNQWNVLRLDGTVSGNKRTKIVAEFNDPTSSAFVFLLSSKAGGCGINLIGGSRLVLFDPDWNPASDKQAAARIWREGQKRRCFIYRFMSSGTIEEKIIQRQLSKEGLADIVDNKDQVNVFSTEELRQLFEFRKDTRSDTHDTLRCKRCNSVKVLDYKREKKVFPPAQLEACDKFLTDLLKHLETEAALYHKRETKRMAEAGLDPSSASVPPLVQSLPSLPLFHEVEVLRGQLLAGEFPSLPSFSKRQREVMVAIDAMHTAARSAASAVSAIVSDPSNDVDLINAEEEAAERCMNEVYLHLFPPSFSIYNEFLNLWSATVPVLTMLATSKSSFSSNGSGGSSGGGSGEDSAAVVDNGEEVVEQEGCPEESDFNKWSHHCSVNTCDDELLQRAMGDDTTISFVFGLEVNWSLLLAKIEETREENELRKEQQRLDLEELNERRRRTKARKEAGGDDASGSSGSSDTGSGAEEESGGVIEKNDKGKKSKKGAGAGEKKIGKKGGKKETTSPVRKRGRPPAPPARESDVILLDDDPIDDSHSSGSEEDEDEAGILMATQLVSQRPSRHSVSNAATTTTTAAAAAAAAAASAPSAAVAESSTDFNWDDDDDHDDLSGPYDFSLARLARPTPPPPSKKAAAPTNSTAVTSAAAAKAKSTSAAATMKPPPVPVLKDSQSSAFTSSTTGTATGTSKYKLTQRKRIVDDDEEEETGEDSDANSLLHSTPGLSLDDLPKKTATVAASSSSAAAPSVAHKRMGRVIASDSEDDDNEGDDDDDENYFRKPPLGKENKLRSPLPVKKTSNSSSTSSSSASGEATKVKASKTIIDITNTQAGPVTSHSNDKLLMSQEEWSCHVCTFMNPYYSGSCDMCDTKRAGGSSKRKRSQDSM